MEQKGPNFVREQRRHTAKEEGQTKVFAESRRTSHLPIDRLGACSPRRLLFLLPLPPPARWLWALLPQPRVSSSTPPRAFRLP